MTGEKLCPVLSLFLPFAVYLQVLILRVAHADYKEEQANEIEALQSIYPNEFVGKSIQYLQPLSLPRA